MNLEQQAYNPNNPYEASGIGHNAIVNQVLADYGGQISQIADNTAKENFIINACVTVAGQLYGADSTVDPRPGFATIPGYAGLISTLDMNQYHTIIMGLPGVTPSAAQKIIDILGPLTTVPVLTEADALMVLNNIKAFEDQEVESGAVDAMVLSFTSVLKHSLVCWWADPNPDGGGTAFRWQTLVVDGVGFIAGSLAGAAAASTIFHLVTDY